MKKWLFAIVLILMLLSMPLKVFAADVNEPEQEVEITEEEPTIDDLKAEIQTWLEQYLETSMVAKIINWAVDAGVLTALFAVYLKYRKYKHTTLENLIKMFQEKMGVWLKDNFDKLSVEQIEKIQKAIEDLEKSNETMMKVLILMQDNTAKGKAALIEYLGSKTDNEEVKQAVSEVGATLDEQEKKAAEINAKVAGEYEEIF